MLVIRQVQLDELGLQARADFEERLTTCFAHAYPRECRQAGGPAALQRWVNSGVGAALAARYRSQHACGRWMLLAMMLGFDFASDPQLPWVQDCLARERDSDPDHRIDELFDDALNYLGSTAGDDAERVVRAMLRIRKLDFSALPPLTAQAAVDDACDRLQALYPEKFSFQGRELTARTVSLHLLRAREHGLTTPGGAFLFALLAFMLGSGFDHDPLHLWAQAALDPTLPLTADERAGRLESAVREHMATSLSDA
jgi:hypothetical protein